LEAFSVRDLSPGGVLIIGFCPIFVGPNRVFLPKHREFRKEQVRVNAMLRRAAVERDAEQARLAYLQRMHEIEVCCERTSALFCALVSR
jgi:hypothetical protein